MPALTRTDSLIPQDALRNGPPPTPKLEESDKFKMRRARIARMEREQVLEDEAAVRVLQTIRPSIIIPSPVVKAEFTDLDGLSWSDPRARSLLDEWEATQDDCEAALSILQPPGLPHSYATPVNSSFAEPTPTTAVYRIPPRMVRENATLGPPQPMYLGGASPSRSSFASPRYETFLDLSTDDSILMSRSGTMIPQDIRLSRFISGPQRSPIHPSHSHKLSSKLTPPSPSRMFIALPKREWCTDSAA
ncbi:hypothetical protein K474DRAFT_1677291 [Panus rudis PR-1116 ss-1]|nr:hypothetical protein K474DRAFT_1677291 [Panus rudis PR-1116 ss-1]